MLRTVLGARPVDSSFVTIPALYRRTAVLAAWIVVPHASETSRGDDFRRSRRGPTCRRTYRCCGLASHARWRAALRRASTAAVRRAAEAAAGRSGERRTRRRSPSSSARWSRPAMPRLLRTTRQGTEQQCALMASRRDRGLPRASLRGRPSTLLSWLRIHLSRSSGTCRSRDPFPDRGSDRSTFYRVGRQNLSRCDQLMEPCGHDVDVTAQPSDRKLTGRDEAVRGGAADAQQRCCPRHC
jgi:hypothetical protein